jgi:glyoxylase-like metal-dependent hydrolase (beta-lactamase superfamily II)
VKTRIVMAVAFILALGATWLLTARRVVHATPGNVTLVAPGVWFREGDLKSLGHCNNVWIEMNDYVIVVDANFPSGAEACLADVKRTTRKPVKYVFDTHHHGDHAYGRVRLFCIHQFWMCLPIVSKYRRYSRLTFWCA